MTRSIRTMTLAAVALALMALPTTAQTLDEVKASLTKAFSQVQTVKADVVMNMSMGPGMVMKATGTTAMQREGDVVKFRQETRIEMVGAPAGLTGDNTSLSLFDGENMYLITDMMGRKTAIKSAPDEDNAMPAPAGEALWKSLEENYTLSLGGEEKVGTDPCYVIKGEPKDPKVAGPSTYYFDKKMGVLRRIEMKVPDMPGMSTINYTNYELNTELDSDLFVFKAEEGMQVVDSATFSASPPPPAEPAPAE